MTTTDASEPEPEPEVLGTGKSRKEAEAEPGLASMDWVTPEDEGPTP